MCGGGGACRSRYLWRMRPARCLVLHPACECVLSYTVLVLVPVLGTGVPRIMTCCLPLVKGLARGFHVYRVPLMVLRASVYWADCDLQATKVGRRHPCPFHVGATML